MDQKYFFIVLHKKIWRNSVSRCLNAFIITDLQAGLLGWKKSQDASSVHLGHMIFKYLQWIAVEGMCGREVNTSNSGGSGVRCSRLPCHVVSLDKEFYSTLSLFTQVYKWVQVIYCWGKPAMDKHPIQGGVAILLGMIHAKETGISSGRLGLYLTQSGTNAENKVLCNF